MSTFGKCILCLEVPEHFRLQMDNIYGGYCPNKYCGDNAYGRKLLRGTDYSVPLWAHWRNYNALSNEMKKLFVFSEEDGYACYAAYTAWSH